VRIHEDVEAVALRGAQHLDRLGDPGLVVDARAGGLDGLPGEDIADGVVAVALQAGEMEVGLVAGEGPADEADVVAVEEVVGHVRRLMGPARVLGFAGDVDAAQNDLPAVPVAELAILDDETEAGHGPRARQGFCVVQAGEPTWDEGGQHRSEPRRWCV
jgi:hypothetical protein